MGKRGRPDRYVLKSLTLSLTCPSFPAPLKSSRSFISRSLNVKAKRISRSVFSTGQETKLTHVDLDGDKVVGNVLVALQQPLGDGLPHIASGDVFVSSSGGSSLGRGRGGSSRSLELLNVLLHNSTLRSGSLNLGKGNTLLQRDSSSDRGGVNSTRWRSSLGSDLGSLGRSLGGSDSGLAGRGVEGSRGGLRRKFFVLLGGRLLLGGLRSSVSSLGGKSISSRKIISLLGNDGDERSDGKVLGTISNLIGVSNDQKKKMQKQKMGENVQ